MDLKMKLKYASLFALSFAVLTALAFLAGLFMNIEFAPAPVAQALFDLVTFAPVMAIGALIISFAQVFLSLWLHTLHQKWFWPLNMIIAIILGGLGSFFSLWLVWILIAVANGLLNLIMLRFLELCHLKQKSA